MTRGREFRIPGLQRERSPANLPLPLVGLQKEIRKKERYGKGLGDLAEISNSNLNLIEKVLKTYQNSFQGFHTSTISHSQGLVNF
jgi:hypothetical protein